MFTFAKAFQTLESFYRKCPWVSTPKLAPLSSQLFTNPFIHPTLVLWIFSFRSYYLPRISPINFYLLPSFEGFLKPLLPGSLPWLTRTMKPPGLPPHSPLSSKNFPFVSTEHKCCNLFLSLMCILNRFSGRMPSWGIIIGDDFQEGGWYLTEV